jgi:hypothetical protein
MAGRQSTGDDDASPINKGEFYASWTKTTARRLEIPRGKQIPAIAGISISHEAKLDLVQDTTVSCNEVDVTDMRYP